jgi:NADPH:quinone reductase-like Zn-dependent oxidoreductase
MKGMKAIAFEQTGGPEVLALAEVPRLDARPGMVLIKTHAIGVTFADTRFRRGTYVVTPKSVKVSGFILPTVSRGFPDRTRESAERCFALMREGRLKVHIGKTFPLAQAAEAHGYLESRESTGKLILLP